VAWLPADFTHPTWVPVGDGYHLRPIRAADADLDYPAVMGSQPRLWSIFGQAWGWPPASMTYEQDVKDLARHEAEIAGHQSFNYALLDDAETALLGCVYIDPPEKQGADAEVSWWLVDARAGTGLQRTVDALVPEWIAAAWPFTRPRYIGRDLSWADWLALPDIERPAVQVFLETDRLVLRRFTSADADNLVSLDADPDVMRYITGGYPRPAWRSRMRSCPRSSVITSGTRVTDSGRSSRRKPGTSWDGSISGHMRMALPARSTSVTGYASQPGARATPPRGHAR
jgi:RimJ/RimL family protein N-acetyltransferase